MFIFKNQKSERHLVAKKSKSQKTSALEKILLVLFPTVH